MFKPNMLPVAIERYIKTLIAFWNVILKPKLPACCMT